MSHTYPMRAVVLFLLLPALLLARAASGQAYRVVDLGVGDGFLPTALNNRGQVLLTNGHLTLPTIGGLLASSSPSKWVGPASVLWENGGTTPIGLLPGGTYSRGLGLNDAGQVAGFGDTLFTYPPANIAELVMHAFVWQGGGLTDLEPKTTVDPGIPIFAVFDGSFATGINNQGQVTGAMTTAVPCGPGPDCRADPFGGEGSNEGQAAVVHAFRTAPSGLIDRHADDLSAGDPTFTQGWLINNAGQVLGTRTPLGGARSYFISGGGGALPPAGAVVYAMNDSGALVGVSAEHAFVSGAAGGPQGVPFPGASAALGINNRGQIVGTGESGDAVHAFLLEDGQSVDLNDRLLPQSGWELKSAYAINDKGQIVGWGLDDGKFALFFLTPEQIELTLRLQPSKACGGETRKGTVQLQSPAPAGGLEVHLTATPALKGLPETLTFEEGETQKPFEVTAPPAADTVSYQIEASVNSDSGHAIVSAAAALVVDAPEITELDLSEKLANPLADVEVCSDDTPMMTVTLSCPAPPEGLAVTLRSQTSSALQISLPPTVKVEAGKTSAMFAITPGFYYSKFSEETVTISASYHGSTRSTDLQIQPTIDSVRLSLNPVTGGQPAVATIHLNCKAPKGGRAVLVRSQDPTVAFVNALKPNLPFVFVVPELADTFQVTVQTRAVTTPRTVTISAGTPASSDSDDLTVLPAR